MRKMPSITKSSLSSLKAIKKDGDQQFGIGPPSSELLESSTQSKLLPQFSVDKLPKSPVMQRQGFKPYSRKLKISESGKDLKVDSY